MSRPAVFLDRDGVIVEDSGPEGGAGELALMEGAAIALARLTKAGFTLAVVTNQTIVSRGLLSLDEVNARHDELATRLVEMGAEIAGFYVCPHHPNATDPAYRRECDCRKPAPGLLYKAARELEIDLSMSYMVGDRMSDVVAGARAGVRTIQILTGRHEDPLIESDAWPDPLPTPDRVCSDLGEAVDYILRDQQ